MDSNRHEKRKMAAWRQAKVVALCGCMRSGKNTAADVLQEGMGFRQIAIASHLKRVVALLFDLSPDQVEGSRKDELDERWGVAPRQILQYFGTDVMQFQLPGALMPHIGRNFWVNRMLRDMRDIHDTDCGIRFVITDMRFAHEYEAIKAQYPSLCVVRIVRERPVSTTDILPRSEDRHHTSETSWKSVPHDVCLINASLPKFRAEVHDLFA